MDTPSIITLIFLTFCSGYFSASETALFSLSSTKIRAYQSSTNPVLQLIAKLVLQPRDLLVTVFMLNTLVNILLQNVASHMFGAAAGWNLKIGVPLLVTLVLGEVIPKYIGLQNNVTTAYYVAPTINIIQRILKPLRQVIIKITAPISRIMFFFLRKEKSISKEELEHVLRKSKEHGVLDADETELIEGYLTLQNTLVKELMRPREDILYFNIHDPLNKLTYLFVDQECTRIPVCENNIQEIIGIINSLQFFINRKDLKTTDNLRRLLSKPYYVPETTPARLLLRRFNETGQEIAIVVDEYGSVSGLITREDLLEVVIGEVRDLRDRKSLYTRAGENEIIASGKLDLAEFNDIFGVDLTSEGNMVTIGGWLTEQIGDIPRSGTKYETDEFLFQVLFAEPNRVKRLYIRKLPKD